LKSPIESAKVLTEVGVYQGIKYILSLLGIECGECRKPLESHGFFVDDGSNMQIWGYRKI